MPPACGSRKRSTCDRPISTAAYVGRYTHRVAIANHRLIAMDEGHVRVRYKDYRAERADTQKTMTLAAAEFIRRFLLHVLPPGFHRIRYYGFLGNRHRTAKLDRCRQLLRTVPPPEPVLNAPPTDYRDRYQALTAALCVAKNGGAKGSPLAVSIPVGGNWAWALAETQSASILDHWRLPTRRPSSS